MKNIERSMDKAMAELAKVAVNVGLTTTILMNCSNGINTLVESSEKTHERIELENARNNTEY